jgi:hypothetical protein
MGRFHPIAGVAFALLLDGCAIDQAGCRPGDPGVGQVVELFFGLSRPGGREISEAEWRDFAATGIAPVLPAGFTVLDGRGHWLNPDTAAAVDEGTKLLIVVFPECQVDDAALTRITDAYKRRFEQSSVLRLDGKARIAF